MQSTLYEFGRFKLDADQRILLADDRPIAVPFKEMETLLVLVQNHGRIVEKQELMELVWPDVFVEEGNLARHISYLRSRLGDSASGSEYVETVPRRGYRFVAPVVVRTVNGSAIKPVRDRGGKIAQGQNAGSSVAIFGNRSTFNWVWPGIVVSLFLSVGAVAVYRNVSEQKPGPFEHMAITKLTDSGDVSDASISGDGRYLAYVQTAGDLQSVWIKHLKTSSRVQVVAPSPGRYLGVTFSPDGNYLYLVQSSPGGGKGTGVYRTSLLGTPLVQVAKNADTPVSVSPDGRELLFFRGIPETGETQLVIARADGGEERVLVGRRAPATFVGNPAWSSDGRKAIAYVLLKEPDWPTSVAVIDVESGRPNFYGRFKIANGQAVPVGTSGYLLSLIQPSTRGRGQIGFMGVGREQIRPITNDLHDYSAHLSVTSDGKSAVSVQKHTDTQLWVVPVFRSEAAKQVTSTEESFTDVRWMNNSRLLTRNITGDIVMRDHPSGEPSAIPAPPIIHFDDDCDGGKFIVYSALVPNTRFARIFRANTDGGTPVEISHGNSDLQVVCSPVNRNVYYLSREDNRIILKKTTLDGSSETKLLTNVAVPAGSSGEPIINTHLKLSLSRDGTKLLLGVIPASNSGSAVPELRVLDTNQDRFIFSKSADFERIRGGWFTPDNKALVLNIRERGVSNLWLQPLGEEVAEQLTFFNSGQIFGGDFSPDAKHMVLVRGDQKRDAVLIAEKTP